jgi:Sulfotransferase domain
MPFLSYELLHANTAASLMQVLEFGGIDTNRDLCERSVANNAFARLQEREKKKTASAGKGNLFHRKGKVAGGKQELRDETNAMIWRLAAPVYQQAVALVTAFGS